MPQHRLVSAPTVRPPPQGSALDLAVSLARGLHEAGAPAWRVERAVDQLGERLGVPFTCFAVPTGLQLSDGDRVRLLRCASGEVDLTAQHALERTVHAPAPRASLRHTLRALARRPPLTASQTVLGNTAVAVGAAILFGGGEGTVLAAGLAGMLTGLLVHAGTVLGEGLGRLVPLFASFGGALIAGQLSRFMPVDAVMAAISGIVVLLPGLSLTIGVGEVAAGHLSAGAARLTGAGVMLLLLGLGTAAGAGLAPAVGAGGGPSLPLLVPVGFLLTVAALGLVFRARRAQLPWVGVGVALAWLLPLVLVELGTVQVSFLTAALLGLAGNLLTRRHRMPAQVLTVPGILMLVPGGSSLRAVGALLRHDLRGVEVLADSLATSGALVTGLLVAGLALPPVLNRREGLAAALPGG